MKIDAGFGYSKTRNPKAAAREATDQALAPLGGATPDFVWVISSVGYPSNVILRTIRERTGGVPLAGCTGNGVVGWEVTDEGAFYLGVMAIKSASVRFQVFHGQGVKADSHAVGDEIGAQIARSQPSDAVGLIVMSDGLGTNFDKFTQGLRQHVGEDELPMFGGLAGDNWRMKETLQFHDDEVITDGVVAVLISGDARLAWSVNHGCVAMDRERTITKADQNKVYEIDGEPVLEVFKEYLRPEEIDNWDQAVVNLCLGFKAEGLEDYDEYQIRFMPGKDDATGAVLIPTEVEPGTSVWMTRRDKEKIINGVDRIGDSMVAQLGGQDPALVFHFDCAGRGNMIFRDDEKKQVLDRLESRFTAPWMGFYTYGEIGPVGGRDCFHNYTLVLLALY